MAKTYINYTEPNVGTKLKSKEFNDTSNAQYSIPINSDEKEGIKFADSPNIDAFSRLRTSNPETLFDSQFQSEEVINFL